MSWDNEIVGPMTAQELRSEVIHMGNVGWELVNAYTSGVWHYAALRRPVKVAVYPMGPVMEGYLRMRPRAEE